MAATDSVLSDLTEGIYTITLNRPDKLNCINLKMLDLLAQCLLEAETRDDINIVVFRGAGERAFSTGGDLTVFNGLDHNETARWIKKGHELFNRPGDQGGPVSSAGSLARLAAGLGCVAAVEAAYRRSARQRDDPFDKNC